MKLDHRKIHEYAHSRGTTLAGVLREAGVSRTAYYSLVSKNSVLPKSVLALATALGIRPSEIMQEVPRTAPHEQRLALARSICERHPGMDFHNVWHTLTLLERRPAERLARSLKRGGA